MTRLRYNITDPDTNEQTRTYLAGASIVGTPSFTHGASPVASFGLTAINPDVSDLFVEHIKDDQYLTSNGKEWAPLDIVTDTIKVRFGSDIKLETKRTRNGVLLPMDYLQGPVKDLLPWVSKDVFKTDMVDGKHVQYALGNVYDPLIAKRLGHDNNDHDFNTIFQINSGKKDITALEFIEILRHRFKVVANVVFALRHTGEIGYFT